VKNVEVIRHSLSRWQRGESLSRDHAFEFLCALTDQDVPQALSGGALVALNMKGVTAFELQGFAEGMRHLAHKPALTPTNTTVDIVGTGGDSAHSFNLSTGSALLSAASGVAVIKHGNRAVSSRSGSADVLTALGIKMPMDEASAVHCFHTNGFAFLFAPQFHPAMKTIAPIRQALGVRTVFNLLGPLTNPSSPPHIVLGVYSEAVAELLAQALMGLSNARAFVVHGLNGWDEPTPAAPFKIWDVSTTGLTVSTRSAADYGLPSCSEADLKGGDATVNAKALLHVLSGQDQGPHRHALLLGGALAMEVTGVEPNPTHAIRRLTQVIDNGYALQWINQLIVESQVS